jgi:hypothetical protein
LILDPDPALAPVIPFVTVPIVHENVVPAPEDAVRAKFGLVPLQIVAVLGDVKNGDGSTVTVMVKGVPMQEPAMEVGVTI